MTLITRQGLVRQRSAGPPIQSSSVKNRICRNELHFCPPSTSPATIDPSTHRPLLVSFPLPLNPRVRPLQSRPLWLIPVAGSRIGG